jgi:hypothetical protein
MNSVGCFNRRNINIVPHVLSRPRAERIRIINRKKPIIHFNFSLN